MQRAHEDPSLYFSRELSWLEFNDRVLEEAMDERNPLLERLKFLAIYSKNLDEYFMVRVAGLKQQVAAEVVRRLYDGRLPSEQLQRISLTLRASLQRHMQCLREIVLPALQRFGIEFLSFATLDAGLQQQLRDVFVDRVFPVLTPLAVDRSHPFPYISNLSLSLAVEIEVLEDDGTVQRSFARVKVPNSLPRFLPFDGGNASSARRFVMLEDLIASNLDVLFPGVRVKAAWAFRVTRDADLDLQEDEAHDLLSAIESELRRRRFGEPVRLEVEAGMPLEVQERLLDALDLEMQDCYELDGPLAISDFFTIAGLEMPGLRDAPFVPAIPRRLVGAEDLFSVIREGDLMLHHPYESFDPVVQFVHQAADDPKVLAIKQTLYRASGNASPILAALERAAESGKQVAVMIELKARFDEENNIEWARRLERVGAHVVYGSPQLKTHAKIALVVRKEADGLRRYVHIGTGNYSERTAKIYTDISLFTCNPSVGRDATQLFNALTGFSKKETYETFLVAPRGLRTAMFDFIEREAEHALRGRPAGIIVKVNALSDGDIVRALYRASRAGVPIELIVRGVCVLRPGVPGLSETIRVRSIVGPFLEHSRIFLFENGGQREVYIGSADWMSRNLDRRVELVIPVQDPVLMSTLADGIIPLLLADNVRTRILHSTGIYERLYPAVDTLRIDAQFELLKRAGASGIEELPYLPPG